MKVKICSNINCQISKSVTSFDIQDINCPYCNSPLILRLPDLNLNENELLQYEEYTNTIFEDYNSEEYSLVDFSKFYSFIANEWYNWENLEKALFYNNKALDICSCIPSMSNHDLETLHSNLGNTYTKLENYEKALDHFKKCLEIQKTIYNRDDIILGWTYKDLADTYLSLNILDESIENYKLAISICESTDHNDYNGYINLYNCLGDVLMNNSNPIEAIPVFEKGISLTKQYFSDTNPYVGMFSSKLGDIYFRFQDFKKAVYYFEIELTLALPIFEDKDLIHFYWKIGNCYHSIGDYTKAINNYLMGFKMSNNKLGGFPTNIARCLEEQNKLHEALMYYRLASEIRINGLGIDSEVTIETVKNHNKLAITLGENCINLEDYNK